MDNGKTRPLTLDGEGYEVVAKAVMALMDEYSAIAGDTIVFEALEDGKSGVGISADSSALVISETHDVLGGYSQRCQFVFFVVYRSASTTEREKLRAATFLDRIGKWLCGERVEYGGEDITLEEFPKLADGRKITRITRQNYYGTAPDDNGVQDWLLPVTVEYTNEIPPKW